MTGLLDFDRVTARGVVKTYGATRALAGVDLELRAGRVTVIEGANGSGKSTLATLLTLVGRPTRGTVRWGEHDGTSQREGLRARIGVLAHAAMMYPDLSGIENLALAADLFGVRRRDERIQELRERFEIASFGDRPVRTYSRGQLQRVALARALIHAPRLLVLDEPSTGLDTRSVERLVVAMRAERARGAIIALITHDAPLAGELADVRVLLERGRVVSVDRNANQDDEEDTP